MMELRVNRFPPIDGDSIVANVHEVLKVRPSGIYKVTNNRGKSKIMEIRYFWSMMLGPVRQVTREIKSEVEE